MTLPAGGWSPIGSQGFKYKDATLASSPVKVAIIKATQSGNFLLKIIAKSAAITVSPGFPTLSYGTNLKINSGDEYCASSDQAAPTKNDNQTFMVKRDTGIVCTAPACSSPSGAFIDVSATF